MLHALAAIILGYLIGTIEFAYIITKWKTGKDIRTIGSGNVGFTNAKRALPKKYAYLVFCGDAFKGTLASWVGLALFGNVGGVLAALMSVLGHMFPFWLNFKGGKGVATGFGSMLGLVPIPALLGIGTYAVLTRLTGYVCIGSTVGAFMVPFAAMLMGKPMIFWLPCYAVVAVIIYKHKENFIRLKNGTEKRIDRTKKED